MTMTAPIESSSAATKTVVPPAGTSSAQSPQTSPQPHATTAMPPPSSPMAETTTITSRAPTQNPRFGQAFTYDDGLSVTIAPPTPYSPSESASTDDPGYYVAFSVTVVNGSPDTYDPDFFYVTCQSDNLEAEQVFDSAQGVGSPSTTVLPGREAAFTIVFTVSNPADIVLEVTPGFDYEPAIFTS
ncbi:hypothetical protein GV789_23285 [Nocardia cyriacigeorgica]|uniref:DUF4352 domain-containing protein n=1 Tax=Nocardia cyriacigeorgica TaxID=135487 RepID=A0A6P1DDW9_9NOCA|nr:hypothetical protein [Nocardia cyriacigeorgica]